jgi:CubicO group peptidase (beta-lactamase class C family)
MKFAPGERFGYSNAGFIVLGMIVEQHTGMRFGEYVEQHVFARAGMTDSGYFALDRLPGRTAYGYIEDDAGAWHTNIYSIPVIGQGDGGPFVTAPDMAKFWSALFAHRLLSPAMTEGYLHPHIAAESETPNWHYGYGIFMVKEDDTVTQYFGIGGDPGTTFVSVFYKQHRLHGTIIGNTESPTWPLFSAMINTALE